MQEEMEAKLQEQVEAIKTKMLSGSNMVLNQLQKCFPGVVILDLSSMSVLSTNEGRATDAYSLTATYHTVAEICYLYCTNAHSSTATYHVLAEICYLYCRICCCGCKCSIII